MANVQPLTREEASEFSELLGAVEQSMGYVPESMMTMAHMPGLLKAFAPLGPAIMGPGKVDLGLKSLVAQISSTAAGCRYCTACLLYTSPSPRDKRQSRMPSSA